MTATKELTMNEIGLLNAAWSGDLGKIQEHVKRGADINTEDEYGNNVLMIVSQQGCSGIIPQVISMGGSRLDEALSCALYGIERGTASEGLETVAALLAEGAGISAATMEAIKELGYPELSALVSAENIGRDMAGLPETNNRIRPVL